MSKTINRGKLYRAALQGKLEVQCMNDLSDDYRADAAGNFGRTEWMPAIIDEKPGAYHPSKYTLTAWHFKTKGGSAYQDDAGAIRLNVYQGYCFEVRISGSDL